MRFRIFLLLAIVTATNACSPLFVMRAAYEESKILLKRRDIERVIADPNSTPEERSKLDYVRRARLHAQQMGLNVRDSFTKYSKVDQDVLNWVVTAARDDSFSLYTWWFPIVGTVPYKGFFDKADALAEKAWFESQGYEVSIYGAEAFSTLGWFNDPVVSTTLRHEVARIVNTVIHENLHSTVWIPGRVDFNESLANFVGTQGAVEFFEQSGEAELLKQAQLARQREYDVGQAVEALFADLDGFYKSFAPREIKLRYKAELFAKHTAALRAKYPDLKILRSANNAELIQLKLYLTGLRKFEALYNEHPGDWSVFLKRIEEIKTAMEAKPTQDPFELLLSPRGGAASYASH